MSDKNKKLILILFLTVLLLAVGLFILDKSGIVNISKETPEEEQVVIDQVNYDPPTDEEKQAGDIKKEEISEQTENPTEPSESPESNDESSKKEVDPIITSAGQFDNQIEVRSFIPGIYEASGTCTIVFTKEDNKIERQVEGIQDATTTRCDTVTILRQDFPSSGTWNVKVSYSSPSSQGESDVTSFNVN